MIWVSEGIQENVADFMKIQANVHCTRPSIFTTTKFYRFENLALSHVGLYFMTFQYFRNN